MAKSPGFPAGEEQIPPLEPVFAPDPTVDPTPAQTHGGDQAERSSGLLAGLRGFWGWPRTRGGQSLEPPAPDAEIDSEIDDCEIDSEIDSDSDTQGAGDDLDAGPTGTLPGIDPASPQPTELAVLVDSEFPAQDGQASLSEPVDPTRLGLPGLSPDNAGPGAAAFFDVDNTTIRGSSFVALAKGMADRDYFTTAEIMSITWKQLKFVVSGRENMDDITAATENGLEFVKGREVTEIQTLSDEVYDEKMVKRLWAGTLALTQAHLSVGHQVWLVSATPREVAEVIAARLGLTGGLGTVAEVQQGRYTGRLSGLPLHGQVKAEVVAELAATHGLDLARCSAYSDSANDIPMLSVVGYPVAINPDGRLRAHARANGWPIRDYRIRGRESVRKGVPAAASAGLIAGVAVGVAKGIATLRGRAGA